MSTSSFDPEGKTLLVISGGGCSHIENALGCLSAIVERGVHFDMAFGTSAGALVSAMFMSMHQDIDRLIRLIKETPFYDLVRICPIQAIKSIFSKSNYIADNTGLKEMLLSFISQEGIEKTRVSVSKMTNDGKFSGCEMAPGRPEYVLASMSFQSVFPPVRINGQLYADGGVNDNIPLPKYMDIPKYKHIYMLLSQSSHLMPSFKKWPFVDRLLSLIDNTMNREAAQIDQLHFEEAPNITILKPDKYVESAKFLGWSTDFEQIDYSREYAKNKLAQTHGYPAVFPELGYTGGDK